MELDNGRYRLIRRLGIGGTGSVYQAADVLLGRTVAIKVLHDPIARSLLVEEGASLARLNHPGVVTVYDLISEGGQAYLVLEYVDGCDLDRWMADNGPLELSQALDVVRQVAMAVRETHAQGLLHCDLKPGNVLLSTMGEVKLTDFTLAQQHACHGYQGVLGASTGYAAPEQLSGGPLSPRTDIYGLGALLRRMLDVAQLTSSEGRQVLSAIDRAMEVDPAARFATVDDFLCALPAGAPDTRLVGRSSLPDLTRVAHRSEPERPGPKRSPLWAPLVLCCALLLAAAGALTHFPVHAQPARATVPDLVGTQRASAELVVRSLGLHPHIIARYSATVPAGEISSQNPGPGAAVSEPSSVTLIVSKGPAPVPVPDAHRLTQAAAISILRARGFKAAVQTSDDLFDPAGIVLDQSIPPGAARIPGTVVTLTVSRKPWWWIF